MGEERRDDEVPWASKRVGEGKVGKSGLQTGWRVGMGSLWEWSQWCI